MAELTIRTSESTATIAAKSLRQSVSGYGSVEPTELSGMAPVPGSAMYDDLATEAQESLIALAELVGSDGDAMMSADVALHDADSSSAKSFR